MRGLVERPKGLTYVSAALSPAEEARLLQTVRGLDFSEVRMHGQVARRVVRHYGASYDFDSGAVSPGEPLPHWLSDLRALAGRLLGREPDQLAEALVTRYPPGATIGWHRDAPAFGAVVGVSLGTPCLLRFQRGSGAQRRIFEQRVEPRSAYVLAGEARTSWQHSIPPVPAERYSVTFRTLRTAFR